MKICSNCGQKNAEELHICLKCASPLERLCAACGHSMPDGNKFCGHCGTRLDSLISSQDEMLKTLQKRMPQTLMAKIGTTSLELVGQRRDVTVLFLDVINFNAISQQIGSEEIYLIVDELMKLLVDVIYQYEGTVEKFTGDGLMALFGLPVNHENDPERAIRAALEMQESVKPLQARFKLQHHLDLDLRLGINTGLVIAGSLGSEHHMEYSVIGDTVNLASRLEGAAEPKTILVSFRTYQRTRPVFNFKSLPPLTVKGMAEPVRAYRPLEARAKPGQVRGLPGLQVPLIGRKKDLDQLTETLAKTLEDHQSRIVLLSGEAGLGKSRLVAEFRKLSLRDMAHIFQGTCASYMRMTPYRVIGDIIRDIILVSKMDPDKVQQDILRQHLDHLGLEHREIFPYLLYALGLPQVDLLLETRIKLLNPDMLQRQTHSALRALFIAEAHNLPVVMIFEDLHWVDPASRDFLSYLIQSLNDIPILLVLIARNFRTTTTTEPMAVSAKKLYASRVDIQLQPLSDVETRLLIEQLVGETTLKMLPIMERITSRAGGNPYYIEELLRILMEEGGLIRQNEGLWQLTPQADKIMGILPGTLQDIILARFDRLSEQPRQILQKASVLGRSFVPDLLEILVENSQDLSSSLHILQERDFLISTQLDIEQGYIFKHPLLQEAIYNTMLKRDLQKIHYEVANAIEEGAYWLPGGQSEVLAHHFSKSSWPENAIPHLIKAAENAGHQFANETAAQYFREALDLIKGASEASDEQLLQCRIGLGQALKFMGDFGEGTKTLEDAIYYLFKDDRYLSGDDHQLMITLANGLRELADIRAREGELNVAVGLLQAGVNLLGADGFDRYAIHWRKLADRRAWVCFRQGKLDEAFKLADLALLDVKVWEEDDPITLASLNNTLGGIYWQRGRQVEAIRQVERSLEIYKGLNYYWGMAIAFTNLGVLNYSQGEWPEAVSNFEQADTLRQEHGYTPERPTNLKNMGELLIYLGEYTRAREKLTTSRDISLQLGMDLLAAYAEIGLCRLAVTESNIKRAVIHLENAKNILGPAKDESDDRVIQILFLEALIIAEQGDVSQGLEAAKRAYQLALEGGFQGEETETLRVVGSLYARLGDYAQAETELNKSIELAKKLNDRYRQAQALFELGQIYLTQIQFEPADQADRLEQARNVLEKAIQYFERLGAKQDLKKAQKVRIQVSTVVESLGQPPIIGVDTSNLATLRAHLKMPEGEWHQAVVLYIKMLPQEGVDDEFFFETVSLLYSSIIEIIRKNGGEITRQRDSFTVIFGAPVAQEDDPERAVETALQVTNFYHELARQTELPVTIKIIVTMGKLIFGYVGPKENKHFIVAGEPVQQAEFLAEIARPTRVWVTVPVQKITEFRFKYLALSLSPFLFKHLSEVGIFGIIQLQGERDEIGAVRGLLGLKTSFVGRKEELETMFTLSRNLEQGIGGFIWIDGTPGIGKSRLMREFAASVAGHPATIWSGACSSRRSDHAFSLFSDILLRAFEVQTIFTEEQIITQIDSKLSDWPQVLQDSRPFFQLLLGVQPTGIQGKLIASLEPEQFRRQTFVALRKFIEVMSDEQPLVLLFDDMQWIDPISADLLLFISNLIASKPIMILATQRTTEATPSEHVLEQALKLHTKQAVRLLILPLSVTECRSLLAGLLFRGDELDDLINLVVQQSGGNPYFIEEFIRMLIEQGHLRSIQGQLELVKALRISALEIPSSLEMVIRTRVDALPVSAKKVIQVASVIGQKFNRDLVEKISMQSGTGPILESLQARGMLIQNGEKDQWQFSHPLIETIVYNAVLRVQRTIIHKRAAEAIETQWKGREAEHAEELAYHFSKAEENKKAIFYLVLAGERAAARYANEEALIHFTQASELLSSVPGIRDEIRWRIATGLGEVYQFIGNFDASIIALETALDLTTSNQLTRAQKASIYRHLGETMRKKGVQEYATLYLNKALEVLDTPFIKQEQVEAARILTRLGWSRFLLGDFSKALEVTQEAQVFAQKGDNPNVEAAVSNLIGGISFRLGELKDALHHTDHARKLWEEIGFSWGVAMNLSNMGILEVSSGNMEAGYSFFQKSLELRQDMGDVEGVAITHNNLGKLSRDRGDLDLSESHFRDSLAVARPFRMIWQSANASLELARTLLYKGYEDEAQEVLSEGIQLAEELNAQDIITEAHVLLAEIFLTQQLNGKAKETAVQAASAAMKAGNRVLESSAWRVAAASWYQEGNPLEAHKTLAKARTALLDNPDELETGRVHAQASQIYQALDNFEEAKECFEAAKTIFERLGAERDLIILEQFFADEKR